MSPCSHMQRPSSYEAELPKATRSAVQRLTSHLQVEVNGAEASPVFTFLKHNMPGVTAADLVKSMETSWNFEKILVSRQGRPVRHFGSAFEQADLERAIEAELARTP